jgi:signal peptidase
MKPEKDENDNRDLKSTAFGILKDVFIAFIIVAIIIGSVFAYTGNWPPVVVVESKSMQVSATESFLGIIDTGDLVLVKKIQNRNDVTTYVQGRASGYSTYGDYGDVIVYKKNGYDDVTPVIHRTIIWLEYNETSGNFDIPGLKGLTPGEDWIIESNTTMYNRTNNVTGILTLNDVGYKHNNIKIELEKIKGLYSEVGLPVGSGFITMGDYNNPISDQGWLMDGHYIVGYGSHRVRLVEPSWVVGVARGELPWFGLIKLWFSGQLNDQPAPENSWHMLGITIAALIIIPIAIDLVLTFLDKRKRAAKKDDVDKIEEELEEEPQEVLEKESEKEPEDELDDEELEGEPWEALDDEEIEEEPGEELDDEEEQEEESWEDLETDSEDVFEGSEEPPPKKDMKFKEVDSEPTKKPFEEETDQGSN